MLDAALPHCGGDRPCLSWEPLAAALRAVVAPLDLRGLEEGGAGAAAASAAELRENFPLALLLSLMAGAATGLGGLVFVAGGAMRTRSLGLWQGAAAGFMAAVSFLELVPSAAEEIPAVAVLAYAVLGAGGFLLLRRLVPEPDLDKFGKGAKGDASREVLWSGIATAIGVSLHNVPEGISVCLASLKGVHVGLPLALSISLHNVPEGICVAMPLYFATNDRWYAVRMAFYSGMAEPLGVVLMLAAVQITGVVLTKAAVAAMLAAVAGVMLIICAVELVPQAVAHAGVRDACSATVAGLVSMSAMLVAIDASGIAPH